MFLSKIPVPCSLNAPLPDGTVSHVIEYEGSSRVKQRQIFTYLCARTCGRDEMISQLLDRRWTRGSSPARFYLTGHSCCLCLPVQNDMRDRQHTVVPSLTRVISRWLVLLLLPGAWWVLIHG